jgi:hypothetical protein
MDLVIKNKSIPIKAIPKETLKETLETTFAVWVSDLLGLTGEDSAKRLILSLPAIEKHFWSLGFEEIQKAFTMYADGELKTQPLPNYFTRILVGQIFKEYRDIKKTQPKPMDETKYKKEQDDLLVIQCFDAFIQDRKIKKDFVWVYTYLENQIGATNQEKKTLFHIAKEQKVSNEKAIELSKLKLLNRYFSKLEAKDQHIKDFL